MAQFQPPTAPLPPYTDPQQYQPPPREPNVKAGLVAITLIVLVLIVALVAYGIHAQAPTTIATATPDLTATAYEATYTAASATEAAQATAYAETPLATAPPYTPVPTPPPNPHGAIGVTQTSGSWAIIVNSIKPTQGGQFDDAPKAGDTYILINFTAKNTGSANASMSPIYFTLRDNQGDTFDLAYITVPSDPRGDVVAGQQLRGDLSYEIPKSLHSLVLQFDDPHDFDSSQIVQWQLSL